MNLTPSLGTGAASIVMAKPEAPPPIARPRRTNARRNETPTLELAFRFVAWAHQLERFPDPEQIQPRFEVSRATAWRWRSALAAAYGIVPPRVEGR